MAETLAPATPSTIEQLNVQEEAQLKSLRAAIEQERQKRLQAARGQAISRGLSGSSFEQRAISEVNRVLDQALTEGETSVRGQFLNSRLQIEETEKQRAYEERMTGLQNDFNALEAEKQRAYAAGQNEVAREYEAKQNEIQRSWQDEQNRRTAEAEEDNARREAQSNLVGQGTQLAALGFLTRSGGGASSGATGTNPGTFSTALNKSGSIFGMGSNPVAGSQGPALPTFTQGLFRPYSTGTTPGGAGATGQALGFAAGTAGGAYLGQKTARGIFDDYETDKATSRGAKAGSLFGGAVGSYFGGPVVGLFGGAAGGAYGGNLGSNLSRLGDLGAGASDNKGVTIENVGKAIVKNPGKSLESIWSGATGSGAVVKAAKKIFCFLPDTPVEMVGDKAVPIGLLRLGDRTLGGQVISIRRALSDDLFCYEGIYVTGSHAIREDGQWIRVGTSKKAVPIPGRFEVVSIVTTGHRIYSMGLAMADEVETEDYEDLSIDESLEALNQQEEAKQYGS